MATKLTTRIRKLIGPGKTTSERGCHWMATSMTVDQIKQAMLAIPLSYSTTDWPDSATSYAIFQGYDHREVVISYMED